MLTAECFLFHLMLRRISLASDDVVFGWLTVHIQLNGSSASIYQFNFDLAIASILLGIGGVVREQVLIANGVADVGHHFRELPFKTREVGLAPGNRGIGLHFIV